MNSNVSKLTDITGITLTDNQSENKVSIINDTSKTSSAEDVIGGETANEVDTLLLQQNNKGDKKWKKETMILKSQQSQELLSTTKSRHLQSPPPLSA
eukprot:13304690-Ditylum_brightwellii.AAC.1